MKLISLAEGDHHELILTDDGQVLGWEEENVLVGSNYKYYSLKQLSFIKGIVGKVTHIGAGYVHSIVLTEGNRIFGWGNNAYGQIGVSHFRFCTKPTETEGIEGKIVKISIGHFHNLVLTQDGKIWGWGRNEEMQIEKDPIKIIPGLRPVIGRRAWKAQQPALPRPRDPRMFRIEHLALLSR